MITHNQPCETRFQSCNNGKLRVKRSRISCLDSWPDLTDYLYAKHQNNGITCDASANQVTNCRPFSFNPLARPLSRSPSNATHRTDDSSSRSSDSTQYSYRARVGYHNIGVTQRDGCYSATFLATRRASSCESSKQAGAVSDKACGLRPVDTSVQARTTKKRASERACMHIRPGQATACENWCM